MNITYNVHVVDLYEVMFISIYICTRGLQPVPGPVTGTSIPLLDTVTGTGRVDIPNCTWVRVRAG